MRKRVSSKTPSTPRATPPPVEEWDFSNCPEDEVRYCCHYEYSRERVSVRDEILKRRAADEWANQLYPGDAEYWEHGRALTFFRLFEEFPVTPWMSIAPQKRRERLAEYKRWEGPFLEVSPERLQNEEGFYPFFPNDVGTSALTSVHVAEIDWTAADDAIMKSFEEWLKRSRPTKDAIQMKTGERSPREVLKYLGAFRLLRSFGTRYDDLHDYVKHHGHGTKWTPVYSDPRAWKRPKQHAKSYIERGFVLDPIAAIVADIGRSSMSRIEKAKAKIRISQMDRAEKRKLMQMRAKGRLEEIIASLGVAQSNPG